MCLIMKATLILSSYIGEDNVFLHVESMADSASQVTNAIGYLALEIADFTA